ncbi:MAG: hypothetical protein ABSD97_07025 [Acidimicrobiales bacterium]|jgi:hypothetical protein
MNLEQARYLLEESQREREAAREQLAGAQVTLESTQLIIQGLLKRYPDLAADVQDVDLWEPAATRLRGAEAVLSVLQVEENQWMTVAAVVGALDQRSLLPESDNPANAVRTALERLVAAGSGVEKGRLNPNGTVVYRYHEPEPSYDEEPF